MGTPELVGIPFQLPKHHTISFCNYERCLGVASAGRSSPSFIVSSITFREQRYPSVRKPATTFPCAGQLSNSNRNVLPFSVEEEASSNSRSEDVQQSVLLLKTAAKTKKVPPSEVFAALRTLEKAKLDASDFLQLIGGTESPGRTWLLVFLASAKLVREAWKGGMGGGQYFPVTAVQRFDATARRIENGVFLGPIGYLTFEGRFSWKKTILTFVFENLNIKIGSLGPFKFNIAKKEDKDRTPGTKDPFFNWFYADEEIVVARGRGGGIAFWCRCTRVS